MKNKVTKIIISLLLCFLILFQVSISVITVAAAEIDLGSDDIIYIENSDDLIDFSKKCATDSWSKNKTIILKNNISLEGSSFSPIPTFGGTFDGAGYTISGVSISDTYAPSGFFAYLQEGAIVKDLHIIGSVTPEGKKIQTGGITGINRGSIIECSFTGTVLGEDCVGGITGHNAFTGIIKDCFVNGEINGKDMTGGIAGENLGLISSCKNEAKVNTISVNPSISLDDLNASLTVDITKLPSLDTNVTTKDTGGISGYSSGIILGCENYGLIGYQHIGYNVGGIVGRSSGHIADSINYAEVLGRKDIGGIAGHMEPHISMELSEDLVGRLEKELNELKELVNDATYGADDSNAAITSRLDSILTLVESATKKADKLAGQITDYGDQTITEINRGSEIVADTISKISDIANKFPSISIEITNALSKFEAGFSSFEEASKFGTAAFDDLQLATDEILSAFDDAQNASDKIDTGLDKLEAALTVNDKEAVENALNEIADGLGLVSESIKNISTALDGIITVFENAGWTEDAVSEIKSLATELNTISALFSTIHDSVTDIESNIDVYWSEISEGADEIIESLEYFNQASVKLDEAFALAETGISKISSGIKSISESIVVNDKEAVSDAMVDISTGLSELATATEKAAGALEVLSNESENITTLPNLVAQIKDISGAISDLSSAASEAASALAKITIGVGSLSENIEIYPEKAEEGASLTISGFDDLSACISKLREVNSFLGVGIGKLQSGLTKLKSGVEVKDEDAIRSALDDIHSALGEIIASTKNIAAIISDMADTMEDAKLWSETLVGACREMSDAFSSFSSAIETIQTGVDVVRGNVTLDLESTKDGIALIREGMSKLSSASVKLEQAVQHSKNAMTDMESASTELAEAMNNFSLGFAALEAVSESLTDIANDVKALFEYLESVNPLQIPKPNEEITATANELYADICEIEKQIKALNSEISSAGSELTSYIRSINEKFSSISDTIISIVYNVDNDDEIFSDASEEDIAAVTTGKMYGCINMGYVYGDINIGGIVGIMGVEYTSDPEDDISGSISATRKKAYELKAILQNCVNYGTIVSKKDCVGSVCGKMDMGLIINCEAYGSAESESGNYVGGLAGLCAGTVRESFAKCTLSGSKYVGGIIGCGVTEAIISTSSKVKDCYSLVFIERGNQYIGAIAGDYLGVYENNRFVSDSLAAINRINYTGQASIMEYDELLTIENLPREFKSFTLSFVCDGEVIQSTEFNYGDSFDSSFCPSFPQKDGYYAVWNTTDLGNLKFDTVITAVYKQYVTAIESEQTRNEQRPVFYIEGLFTNSDKLVTEMQPLLSEGFTTKAGEGVVEQWTLIIPDDSQGEHTVRFLTPDKKTSGYRIYVKNNGVWEKATITPLGSYLTFSVSGNEVDVAVVTIDIPWWQIVIAILSILLLIAIIVSCVALIRNSKKKMLLSELEGSLVITSKSDETIKNTVIVSEVDEIEDSSDSELDAEEDSVVLSSVDAFAHLKERKRKSFDEKFKELGEEMQQRYLEVSDYLLSIPGIKSSKSKFSTSFKYKNAVIVRATVRGKTVNLYLALDPKKYADTKYAFKDVSEIKAYQNCGMRIKLTSRRQVSFAKELINDITVMQGIKE